MIHQHDHFDGSSLGAWWAQHPASSWGVVAGGAFCQAAFGVRSRLIHQTDAGLGLPRSHAVGIRWRGSVGLLEIGVSVLGVASASSSQRVEMRYVAGSFPRLEVVVPGYSTFTQIIPAAQQPPLITDIFHYLLGRAIYQGELGGAPLWRFRVQVGSHVYETPSVTVAGWDSSHVHVGMVAQRVAGPVTPNGQSIVFVEEFGTDDLVTHELDPRPSFRPRPNRTPITPSLTETPNADPQPIPFKFRVLRVRIPAADEVMQSDAGHRSSVRIRAKGRRVFECAFVGDGAMKEDVEEWLADPDGAGFGVGNFRATIHTMGIGTVDVAMAPPSLEDWRLIGPDVWSLPFDLWEVFDAATNLP